MIKLIQLFECEVVFLKHTFKNLSLYLKKKKRLVLMLILILLIAVTSSISRSPEFENKKLVLEDPTKIVLFPEFEKLIQSGAVDTIYRSKNSPNLLFSVKENTFVAQDDYNTLKKSKLRRLKNQSKHYSEMQSPPDNVIFVYKTFKPDKQDFLDSALNQKVQIIDIGMNSTSEKIMSVSWTLISIVLYILLFKFIFLSSDNKKEKSLKKIPEIKFSDVAGNAEAKEDLQFLVDFLKNPDKYKNMGATLPKGILLYGPPGTGKTLLAKAAAGEAGIPFYERSGSEFVEKFVGVGAQRVRNLFTLARKNAPSIIFIDEIDAIGGVRGSSNNQEVEHTLNQLLVELDGFDENSNVIFIGATNRLEHLDSALVRPGRFDKHICVNLPDVESRKEILKLYIDKKPVADDVSIDKLSSLTFGLSGSALKSLVNEATLLATRSNQSEITLNNFDEAFIRLRLSSSSKKNSHIKASDLKTLAYHEAGHALVYKLLTGEEVHKVTIVGTTSGAGGLTIVSSENEGLSSRRDLYNQMMYLYGGRCAEYILFNKNEDLVTSGASNDLEGVSTLLNIVVNDIGMADGINFKLSDQEKNGKNVMEYKINLANTLFNETVNLLENNYILLESIANLLMEKETIYNEDIENILELKSEKK